MTVTTAPKSRTSLSNDYPVRIIEGKQEKCLATAVAIGFNNSTSRLIAVIDADLQHPPEVLPELIKILNSDNTGIVIASRYTDEGT